MYDNSGPVLATGLVLFVMFVVRVLELVSMHGGTIIAMESGLNLISKSLCWFLEVVLKYSSTSLVLEAGLDALVKLGVMVLGAVPHVRRH